MGKKKKFGIPFSVWTDPLTQMEKKKRGEFRVHIGRNSNAGIGPRSRRSCCSLDWPRWIWALQMRSSDDVGTEFGVLVEDFEVRRKWRLSHIARWRWWRSFDLHLWVQEYVFHFLGISKLQYWLEREREAKKEIFWFEKPLLDFNRNKIAPNHSHFDFYMKFWWKMILKWRPSVGVRLDIERNWFGEAYHPREPVCGNRSYAIRRVAEDSSIIDNIGRCSDDRGSGGRR